jgi:Lsr2
MQKIQTLFIDDIDGTEAEGTVSFGIDGTFYEIDLNAANAAALRDAYQPYLSAARRTRAGAPRRNRRPPRPAPQPPVSKPAIPPAPNGVRPSANGSSQPVSNEEVRAWAKARNLPVKDRGRIAAEVVAEFRSAHRR